jgi:hypothetical protein
MPYRPARPPSRPHAARATPSGVDCLHDTLRPLGRRWGIYMPPHAAHDHVIRLVAQFREYSAEESIGNGERDAHAGLHSSQAMQGRIPVACSAGFYVAIG